jgi:TM2 domain-containing membrane protein YozV
MINVDRSGDIITETYGRLGTELTPQQKQFFQREYDKLSKNPSTAWKLALLLGAFGAHRFYLRQWGWGVTYLLFSWTFIPLVVALVECFDIRERTENYNKEVEQQIIQTMNIIFSISEADDALAA